MAAPKGNKFASHAKPFHNALERAIKQEDGKRIREAAEKLLNAASEGEAWAIAMLADRMDGKPSQQIVGPGEGGEHLIESTIEVVIVDPKG